MMLDLLVTGVMLLIVMAAGLHGRRSGDKPVERFNGGREAHWLPLGASLAASSMSADTPLLIAGAVFAEGLAGNWFWWASAPGVLATLFFFSRLWRRSGVLTDMGVFELRYGRGLAAQRYRMLRAVLEGVFINVLILASNGYAFALVLGAMLNRWQVGAAFDRAVALMAAGFAIMAAFVLVAGFRGLIRSGTLEFVFSVVAGTALAIAAVLGMPGGLRHLPALASGSDQVPVLSIIPADGAAAPLLLLAAGWWHTAPGRGLLVQRVASAQNERAAAMTVGTFAFFHFIARPWGWYLIGMAALFYLPRGVAADAALPALAAAMLPPGLFGVVVAITAMAFTGCVSSRLNLGASYIVNDVVRVVAPAGVTGRTNRLVEVVVVASLSAAAVALVASNALPGIKVLYQFITVMLAGTGFVAVTRWYWWRTSIAAEIASLTSAIVVAVAASALLDLSRPGEFVLATVANFLIGAVATLIAIAFAPATPHVLLRRFHRRVSPPGPGWRGFPAGPDDDMARLVRRWLLANVALFGAMWAVARAIALDWGWSGLSLAIAGLCLLLLRGRDRGGLGGAIDRADGSAPKRPAL